MRLNCHITGKFVDFKTITKTDGTSFHLLKVYTGDDTLTIFPDKDPTKWQNNYPKLQMGQDVVISVRLQTDDSGRLSLFESNG